MSQLVYAIEHTPTERTENGSPVYATSNSYNLDFFGLVSAKAVSDTQSILSLFYNAMSEDPILAMKNLFYLRDVRGGQGRRAIFRLCMDNLFNSPIMPFDNVAIRKLLCLIPEYGRWDDLIDLLSCPILRDHIVELLREQITADLKAINSDDGHTSISLLGKWFPLAHSVSNKTRKAHAVFLRQKLFHNSAKQCREVIVKLRKHLDIVEKHLCVKGFCNIQYEHVPSQAMLRYRKSFRKNDTERFEAYIESVKSGEKKLHANTLYPHQIVEKVLSSCSSEDRRMLDTIWNQLPNYANSENTICVVDTSGSMSNSSFYNGTRPITIALSLGLYFAERSTGVFKDTFITFSKSPALVKVTGTTLFDKLLNMNRAHWDGNTDIEKVFDLILLSAIKFNLPQSELPKTICIISDMEFDDAMYDRRYYGPRDTNTMFDIAKAKFEAAGYELPNVVFWNVDSDNNNVPVTKDTRGAALVSGFSTSLFQQIVERTTPYELMLKVLNSERYKPVGDALESLRAVKKDGIETITE